MTFTALDLLACVVAALLSSHAGRLYRLRIDGSGAGLRISSGAHPKPLSEDGVKPFPCAIYAPDSEVMMDRFPGWEIAGQKSPDAATTEDVENGVQDLSGVMELWPAGILRDWDLHRKCRWGILFSCSILYRATASIPLFGQSLIRNPVVHFEA